MADRIFKGRIIVTASIDEENTEVFPEAAENFDTAHAGGLVPFDQFGKILADICDECMRDRHDALRIDKDSIMIRSENVWIKIDADGTIEIGAGAA